MQVSWLQVESDHAKYLVRKVIVFVPNGNPDGYIWSWARPGLLLTKRR